MFCIQCGEKQLDDTATICSKCAAPIPSRAVKATETSPLLQKQKRTSTRKLPYILISLGIICLMLSFGGCFSFVMTCISHNVFGSFTKSNSSRSSSQSISGSTTGKETKEPVVHKKNEWIESGDFKYQFTLCRNMPLIDDKIPTNGAKFVEVIYYKENITKSTKSELPDKFQILDSQEREFEPRFNGTGPNEIQLVYKDYWFGYTELQPGLPQMFSLVYEMPSDAVSNIIYLTMPKKGLLGDKIKVRLN